MLSVAIIVRDEERHIGAALDSVADLADEVVVLLDERTRDRTADICREREARLVIEPWRGFPAQRNRALELCAGEWVLFLDADERVTPELRDEIRRVVNQDTRHETRDTRHENREADTSSLSPCLPVSLSPAGYWIPRSNIFFGKELRGGGWYPDPQLRLLRRDRAHYDETWLVHELVEIDGETATMRGHLLHLNIERLDELWRKQTSYAYQEAQTLFRKGRRARWRNFLGAPAREFVRRYITLAGWRDGAIGLLLCATLAYFEIVKFAHLKGLERIAEEPQ